MAKSKHLKLPYLLPAQAGKHMTHNEAMSMVDTLIHLAVLDRDLGTPPADPEEGDRYIVADSPTGAWAGKAGQISVWDGFVWLFHTPERGWLSYVIDEDGLLVWTGATWISTVGLNGQLPMVGVNAAPDSSNRLAVASDAVLFTHESDGIQVKLNKASLGNTASLLFQTAFSGRVELGTTGDDKLHVKVSADGAGWAEAMVIDSVGRVGLGLANPATKLDVDGPVRVKSYAVAGVPPATAAGQLIYVADDAGGATIAFSDGTNWRRVSDRAVVG